MRKKSSDHVRERAARKIAEIRAAVSALEFICSGTLLERRKVCGKPNCRCAHDPAARHGPYYEWTRRHRGKLVHRVVTAQQARFIHQAIADHRKILRVLRQWERETIRVIETLESSKR